MDNIEKQIEDCIANGLTRKSIEALLGITFTKEQIIFYKKAKAIYDLKLRKRRSERKYEHLSGTELKRKHDDNYASIDNQLNEAMSKIDWARRNRCKKSLATWVKTYCIGTLLDNEPPEKGI